MEQTRSSKKVRYNSSVLDIDRSSDFSSFSNPNTSVVNIHNNHSIKSIVNCTNLSILNIANSVVGTIKSCPILYSLSIRNNEGMNHLKVSSVREVSLNKLLDLQTVEMLQVRQAMLDTLPSLKQIKMPNATHISINDIGSEYCPKLLKSFPLARHIELMNIKNFNPCERFSGANLKKLIIRNCDIKFICNLKDFDEVVIENCNHIQYVESILDVKILTVINCPNLYRLEHVVSNNLTIQRCNSLRKISQIECRELTIEYCFELAVIPTLEANEITVTRCPSLVKIHLYEDIQVLNINTCEALTYIDFNSSDALGYSNLTMNLEGDNQITEIKDWYVARLTIKHNASLEIIKNIYNLIDLSLIDCRYIYALSDASVLSDLYIELCPSLETVTNIYGFSKMSLIDCDSLTTFEMYLTELRHVHINNCLNLNLKLCGDLLASICLLDCGSVLILNVSDDAKIEIKNVSMMPDMPSKNQSHVNDLRSHMRLMIDSTQTIVNFIKKKIMRKRFLNFLAFKETFGTYDCPICHESICPSLSTVTSCNHMFHSSCLFKWLVVKRSCPLCNDNL